MTCYPSEAALSKEGIESHCYKNAPHFIDSIIASVAYKTIVRKHNIEAVWRELWNLHHK